MNDPITWGGVLLALIALGGAIHTRIDARKTKKDQLDHEARMAEHEAKVAKDKLDHDAELVQIKTDLKVAQAENKRCEENHAETEAKLTECQEKHEQTDRRVSALEQMIRPGG